MENGKKPTRRRVICKLSDVVLIARQSIAFMKQPTVKTKTEVSSR